MVTSAVRPIPLEWARSRYVGVVVSVDLPRGASWAQLELHDDETVALLALQANDGAATIDSVLALRKLLQTAGS